jgi:hypothetical protein
VLLVTAVNLYQTSYETVPAQGADNATPDDKVAPATFPETLLQVFHIGKLIAFAQSSLNSVEAGSVTQISNPALVGEIGGTPVDEYTLMRYVVPGVRPLAAMEVVPQ